MAENMFKREYLPIGSLRHKDSLDFHHDNAQCIWSVEKHKFINPGWIETGHHLISLGIPIGNNLDPTPFLNGRHRDAKRKLASISNIKSIGLVGKN